MGFNPFRPGGKDAVDVALVVGTLLVAAALVAWAILA